METQISAREQVVRIIGTQYDGLHGRVAALDKLVFDQETREGSVAVLKDAFAFWGLPLPRIDVIESGSPVPITRDEHNESILALSGLDASGRLSVDCCACFEGKTADEAAVAVYDLLKSVEAELGIKARVVLLAQFLGTRHIPNADITNRYPSWDAESKAPQIVFENLDLFAELNTLWAKNTSLADLSYWIAHVPCDETVRTALIGFLLVLNTRKTTAAAKERNGQAALALMLEELIASSRFDGPNAERS